MDAPLLDVAPSKPIEAIQADGRYAAENGQTTRSAEWKVPFILERFKTPRRGHIPKGTQHGQLDEEKMTDDHTLSVRCRHCKTVSVSAAQRTHTETASCISAQLDSLAVYADGGGDWRAHV